MNLLLAFTAGFLFSQITEDKPIDRKRQNDADFDRVYQEMTARPIG
jgi:hypothetical protein